MQIEDLGREKDRSSEHCRSHSMQGCRKSGKTTGTYRARHVEESCKKKYQRKTFGRGKFVPVCSYEERNAGCDENSPEDQRDKDGPAKARSAFVAGLESKNTCPGLWAKQSSCGPPLDLRLELSALIHRAGKPSRITSMLNYLSGLLARWVEDTTCDIRKQP
jgi:hypothetical protein